MSNAIPLLQREAHCKDCSLACMCLPIALHADEMDALDRIVKRGRPLRRGDVLFRQGEEFTSIYALRTGAIKTYSLSDNGDEQITGFHLAGELIGMSGMDSGSHTVSAVALETTSVCEIPFDNLDELTAVLPQLRKQLMRLMSRELREVQEMMLLLSPQHADELIAPLLIKLSARFRVRGYSARFFRLPMSRNEIGNYLGLAVESVSRVFTRFQQQELIIADGKQIEITDYIQL